MIKKYYDKVMDSIALAISYIAAILAIIGVGVGVVFLWLLPVTIVIVLGCLIVKWVFGL